MILVSLISAVLAPFVQRMHLTDWWYPNYIFDSFIKIEDLLFGYSAGGVIFAIGFIIQTQFKGIVKSYQVSNKLKTGVVLISVMLLFGLFYFFQIHSFWSSIIAFAYAPIFAGILNPKSIPIMFITGVLVVIIAMPGYLFGIFVNPNWVQNEWLIDQLSGLTILKIPLEEIVWFFFAGIGMSAFLLLFSKQEKG